MMRPLAPRWILYLAATVATAPLATGEPVSSPSHVTKLIAQLGSADYLQREAAHRELAALGPAAMDRLGDATPHEDPEVALRAKQLVRDLQREALWSGSPIHVHGSPRVPELLAAIRGQTRVEINLHRGTQEPATSQILSLPHQRHFWPTVDAVCATFGISPRWQFTTCGTSHLVGRRADGPVTAAYNGALRCEISSRAVRSAEKARAGESEEVELTLYLAWEPKLNVVAIQARPQLVASCTDIRSSGGHHVSCCGHERWFARPDGLPCYTATIRLAARTDAAPSPHVQSVHWDVIAVAPDGTRDRRTIRFDF